MQTPFDESESEKVKSESDGIEILLIWLRMFCFDCVDFQEVHIIFRIVIIQ